MSNITTLETKIFKYEFDISIKNSVQKVWDLLTNQIDQWWMTDFCALPNSTMSFGTKIGSALLETGEDGSALEWYRVQMCVPGKVLYLVGYMAPDWGGPTTSMLKLALKPDGNNCTLTISDALLGNVTDNKAINAESGWKKLFEEGLKAKAEK